MLAGGYKSQYEFTVALEKLVSTHSFQGGIGQPYNDL